MPEMIFGCALCNYMETYWFSLELNKWAASQSRSMKSNTSETKTETHHDERKISAETEIGYVDKLKNYLHWLIDRIFIEVLSCGWTADHTAIFDPAYLWNHIKMVKVMIWKNVGYASFQRYSICNLIKVVNNEISVWSIGFWDAANNCDYFYAAYSK